ncbi:hypothetical protein QFZ31_002268 [Neobacillus niacini]|uniref:hypothetical protein n=1 Tax=Neobacillus driksii TaxID=3035913 RepID=UPI00278B2D01|nr:hypothetical protein [Neobacillus niacini]MDQ0972390.1 hypothetical protein [Neobacillus niacini]
MKKLTKNKPTLEWKQRMDEDDDLFTEENINATNEVLDSYINSLKELNEQMGFSSKIWLLRQPFSFGANWQVSLTRSWKFFKI